jgi:hypothetical protein
MIYPEKPYKKRSVYKLNDLPGEDLYKTRSVYKMKALRFTL